MLSSEQILYVTHKLQADEIKNLCRNILHCNLMKLCKTFSSSQLKYREPVRTITYDLEGEQINTTW